MTAILAELSTNHGGDVELAADMIRAAADAGATYAKLQTYSLDALNPRDPQAEWLRQAHLDRAAHERLIQVGKDVGIPVISTPFDAASLQMLRELGLTTFKIASSESGHDWWQLRSGEQWFVSYPWGVESERVQWERLGRPEMVPRLCSRHTRLTAIPLYPTPLEVVGRAPLLDGWSCHGVGNDACSWALARGVKVLEVHFTIGKGRVCAWDRTPDQVRELRRFANSVETMRSGVNQQFRERWQHGA
jgi:sialic acid synthase SpsE